MTHDYDSMRAERRREAGKRGDFRAEPSLPPDVAQDIDSGSARRAAAEAAARANWNPHTLFR